MSLVAFFQEMVVLYVIGLIGFLARKKGVLNEHSTEVFTQLILSLSLPFLILYSMAKPYHMKIAANLFLLIPISAFILFLSSLIAIWLRRLMNLPKKTTKRV